LKYESKDLEQNLIEKANLAKALQDLNDDYKFIAGTVEAENSKLLEEIEKLKRENTEALADKVLA
jgi:hypothetical protein